MILCLSRVSRLPPVFLNRYARARANGGPAKMQIRVDQGAPRLGAGEEA